MKKITAILIVLVILGGAFAFGYFIRDRQGCVVSFDDPACHIYWADGSMTMWFGGDFVLEPGESVKFSIPFEFETETGDDTDPPYETLSGMDI